MSDMQRVHETSSYARGWEGLQSEREYWLDASQITGRIPQDFSGTFFRNGPGVNKVFDDPLVHPIDGDGLVCRLSFVKGRAHFSSKFVQTKRRSDELAAGHMLYPGQMGSVPPAMLATKQRAAQLFGLMKGKLPRVRFRDPSNTNVFYWGGRLISSYETKLPHELDPQSLDTRGATDLQGELDFRNLAAHFRFDPVSKNIVLLSHALNHPGTPQVKLLHYDTQWTLKDKAIIDVPHLNYIHDFAMTERYYIFHVTPFVVPDKKLLLRYAWGRTRPEDLMFYHAGQPSQFVVVARDNPKRRYVLDASPFHIFHFGNAHEADGKLSFNAVCLGPKFTMEFQNSLWLSNAVTEPGKLIEFSADLGAKEPRLTEDVQRSLRSVEFPTSHPFRHGLPCRYTYLMANIGTENVPFRDIVKFDSMSRKIAGAWRSPGVVGEPIFMPRQATPEYPERGDEDDGYVVCQMYDPEQHKTQFLLFDARQISSGPIATIKLPQHVPYGFHGTYAATTFVD